MSLKNIMNGNNIISYDVLSQCISVSGSLIASKNTEGGLNIEGTGLFIPSTLTQVLTAGNDAGNLNIVNLGRLLLNSDINFMDKCAIYSGDVNTIIFRELPNPNPLKPNYFDFCNGVMTIDQENGVVVNGPGYPGEGCRLSFIADFLSDPPQGTLSYSNASGGISIYQYIDYSNPFPGLSPTVIKLKQGNIEATAQINCVLTSNTGNIELNAVTGNIIADCVDFLISGNLTVSGTFTITNLAATTLAISGASTLNTLSASNTTITGTLGVSGTTTLAVVNSGNHSITGTLNVSAGTTLNAFSAASGNIIGNLTVGSLTLSSLSLTSLTVSGTTNLNTANIANASISGTLGVTGLSTLGNVNASNVTVGGTLGVTGLSTLAGVNSGNTSITGTLVVTGTSTLSAVNSGNHAITGTLSVSGASTLSSASLSSTYSQTGGNWTYNNASGLYNLTANVINFTGPGTFTGAFAQSGGNFTANAGAGTLALNTTSVGAVNITAGSLTGTMTNGIVLQSTTNQINMLATDVTNGGIVGIGNITTGCQFSSSNNYMRVYQNICRVGYDDGTGTRNNYNVDASGLGLEAIGPGSTGCTISMNKTTGAMNFGSSGIISFFDTTGTFQVNRPIVNMPNLPSTGSGSTVLLAAGQLYIQTSSRRFKENIEPTTLDTSGLYETELVKYTYKDSGIPSIGYIAEDLPASLSGLLVYDKEGQINSIAYSLMPLYIIEELKKLNARIRALENIQ